MCVCVGVGGGGGGKGYLKDKETTTESLPVCVGGGGVGGGSGYLFPSYPEINRHFPLFLKI